MGGIGRCRCLIHSSCASGVPIRSATMSSVRMDERRQLALPDESFQLDNTFSNIELAVVSMPGLSSSPHLP